MIRLVIFVAGWFLISYVYLWYPLLVTAFGRHKSGRRHSVACPPVTLVFCAHNEESVLDEKIRNCNSLEYPRDLLEFCIGVPRRVLGPVGLRGGS